MSEEAVAVKQLAAAITKLAGATSTKESDTDSVRELILSNRHDFIKEYYKMATMDLDRHLKGGWQTVVALGGAVIILSAGHENKIGMPIATLLALLVAAWGTLTVIDANYWSLRAIGFLANVESIYFSVADRKYLNPYCGQHPPFKLMNSLQYLYWLAIGFGVLALANHCWEIIHAIDKTHISLSENPFDALTTLFWLSPFVAAAWIGYVISIVHSKRLNDYETFITEASGPGIVISAAMLRRVDLSQGDLTPEVETETHKSALSSISTGKNWHACLDPLLFSLALFVTISSVIFAVML